MGLIAPTVPTVGQPRGSEEVDVLNALNTVIAAFNGNIDAANLAALAVTPAKLLGHDAVVSSLPVGPVDGQECFYLADATNGIVWPLKYRAGSASAFKWEAVGGRALASEVLTNEGTSSLTYVDLTTVGPQLVVPLAGDFDITVTDRITMAGATGGSFMAAKLGAVATADTEGVFYDGRVANAQSDVSKTWRRNLPTAGLTVKAQYRALVAAGNAHQARQLQIRPVRVG